jgi:hypothetical protein
VLPKGDRVDSIEIRSAPVAQAGAWRESLGHFVVKTTSGVKLTGVALYSFTSDFDGVGQGTASVTNGNIKFAKEGARRRWRWHQLPKGIDLPARATRPSLALIDRLLPYLSPSSRF